jgi:hypothetical protein
MKIRISYLILTVTTISLLVSTGCIWMQPRTSVAQRIGSAYGIENFHQVEELRYTFNVQLGPKRISRSWSWQPAADRVVFNGTAAQGGPLTYERRTLQTEPTTGLKKVDAWFINDQYWLLFPFQLVWDPTVEVKKDSGHHKMPIGKGESKRVVVTYPPTGGYTPGDVYELYVDDDYRILQWIYRKGGAPEPTRIATWEDQRRFGLITIALNHQGPDETFRVWFTDVAVKMVGKRGWIKR